MAWLYLLLSQVNSSVLSENIEKKIKKSYILKLWPCEIPVLYGKSSHLKVQIRSKYEAQYRNSKATTTNDKELTEIFENGGAPENSEFSDFFWKKSPITKVNFWQQPGVGRKIKA